jgi:hypothetical protein
MSTRGSRRIVGWRDWLGALTMLAALVTLIWPDWIEAVFHDDPDGGNGALEVGLVIGLALVSIVCFANARSARRRLAE